MNNFLLTIIIIYQAKQKFEWMKKSRSLPKWPSKLRFTIQLNQLLIIWISLNVAIIAWMIVDRLQTVQLRSVMQKKQQKPNVTFIKINNLSCDCVWSAAISLLSNAISSASEIKCEKCPPDWQTFYDIEIAA